MYAKCLYYSIFIFCYSSIAFTQNQCLDIFSLTQNTVTQYDPNSFTRDQLQLLKDELLHDAYSTRIYGLQPRIKPKRVSFLHYLYSRQIVSAYKNNLLLGDKLLFWKLIEDVLGTHALKYHPNSVGLKDFLHKNGLLEIDGTLIKNENRLRQALQSSFPAGFVLKPLLEGDSAGKGIIVSTDAFVNALFADNSLNWNRKDMLGPSKVTSALAGEEQVASGERFLLQEKVGDTLVHQSLSQMYDKTNEYRVHTYGRNVIPGATASRWYGTNDPDSVRLANNLIQSFLKDMPAWFSQRKAFSFDVYISNGTAIIIEMNTNFGKRGGWSGFSSEPQIIGAYVRFFEKRYMWNFGTDITAYLLRTDLANIKVYTKNELMYARKIFLNNEPLRLIQEALLSLSTKAQLYLQVTSEHETLFFKEREFLQSVVAKIATTDTSNEASLKQFFDWVEHIR